jgi:hypothetical protein
MWARGRGWFELGSAGDGRTGGPTDRTGRELKPASTEFAAVGVNGVNQAVKKSVWSAKTRCRGGSVSGSRSGTQLRKNLPAQFVACIVTRASDYRTELHSRDAPRRGCSAGSLSCRSSRFASGVGVGGDGGWTAKLGHRERRSTTFEAIHFKGLRRQISIRAHHCRPAANVHEACISSVDICGETQGE